MDFSRFFSFLFGLDNGSTNQPQDQASGTSILSGARNFQIGNMQVNVNTDGVELDESAVRASVEGWELLLKNISPNALHDSSARFDAPKCDEDTRVEVTGEIMDMIQDLDAPCRLLCMTGAAGAGKSSLQQTIAERCANSGILSAAWFFSSIDPSRNTVSLIVPTIAYQIGLKHDGFRLFVGTAVKHDPHIFSRSLQSQMDALIVRPFQDLQKSRQHSTNAFPYAILIDALDECSGNLSSTSNEHPPQVNASDRRLAEDRQAELLAAIKHCLVDNNLPFRVFIASRPEWAIRTALAPGGQLQNAAYHIQLSDKYDATEDMRRYLRRRFVAIGLRIGNPEWFAENDIETLVHAASGQFVYVATAFKYVSERRASPSERLKVVLTWTPREGRAVRPFEALDRLYTHILLAAKVAYEAVDTHHSRNFLLLFRAYHLNIHGFTPARGTITTIPVNELSVLLGLETGAEDNLISDLCSLVTLRKGPLGMLHLRLYHKSFSDFLEEESRARDLFVARACVFAHFAKCCMRHIVESPLDFDALPNIWKDDLPLSKQLRIGLYSAASLLPYFFSEGTSFDDEVTDFTEKGGWSKLSTCVSLWKPSELRYCMTGLAECSAIWTEKKPEVAAAIREVVDEFQPRLKEVEEQLRGRREERRKRRQIQFSGDSRS